jgi:peptidoglycan/LPS O-acetylase OafA/YrhL
MPDMPEADQPPAPRWRRIGIAITVAWVVVLGYFLLTADPPDLWFEDIGAVDGPGHLAGGLVTGAVAYLFMARRRHGVVLAAGVALVFLIGLEFVQDRLTARGYEHSDVVLSIIGALAGVGVTWAGRAAAVRLRSKV